MEHATNKLDPDTLHIVSEWLKYHINHLQYMEAVNYNAQRKEIAYTRGYLMSLYADITTDNPEHHLIP